MEAAWAGDGIETPKSKAAKATRANLCTPVPASQLHEASKTCADCEIDSSSREISRIWSLPFGKGHAVPTNSALDD